MQYTYKLRMFATIFFNYFSIQDCIAIYRLQSFNLDNEIFSDYILNYVNKKLI